MISYSNVWGRLTLTSEFILLFPCWSVLPYDCPCYRTLIKLVTFGLMRAHQHTWLHVYQICKFVSVFVSLKRWSARRSVYTKTLINPLTPNGPYSGRTAPLTSKRCILYIYSTNIGTEYFKHGICSPFFFLQNAVCFIILTYLVPVLFTFYIQGVLKWKKNNSGARSFIYVNVLVYS